MSHQSYRDVIVVNTPALLKSGFSDTLAVGQLGIFLYDPKKDQTAVYPPNFSTTKIIQLIQGTPELPGNLLGAVANASDRSKPIKGKLITDWQGRAAERGQNQKVTLGFDGVDTTKNITARCEESKTVFIKLSGGPIDQAFHTEGKGYVRQYNIFSGCCDDCGDDCANVNAEAIADDLVKQVNEDPILSLGTRTGNKLYTATKIITPASLPAADATCTEYLLSICDEGNNTALGRVQAQYSGSIITVKSRVGSTTNYQLIQDAELDAPEDFTNEGLILISDCPTCPSGFTAVPSGFAYKVERQDAGSAGALTLVNTEYGIVASGTPALETSVRSLYEYGQSTYVIVSTTEITAAVGTDTLQFLGNTRNSCVLTTPVEETWDVGLTYNKFNKTYTITLNDNVCGVSRLAELQAAYPDLVIVEEEAGECVRQFSTEVESDCVPPGCPADTPKWIAPDAFQGIEWKAATTVGTAANVGVLFETNYIDRVTGDCDFKYWNYDPEPIFIEVSQHSQDYNDKPTICADEWPVTEIQATKLPIGVGSRVREEEAFFKGYDRKYWDDNPIVRSIQDATLQADPNKYYDQYTLSFAFEYNQGWFSEKETDNYSVEVYFPEGTGKEFEAAINAYVSSARVDIAPVVL